MLTKTQSELFHNGILYLDGSPNPNKLNLISGVLAAPFAETIWTLTSRDTRTCSRIVSMLQKQYKDGRYSEALSLLHVLYGLIGYRIPEDITSIAVDQASLQCFLLTFLLDLEDIFTELTLETA